MKQPKERNGKILGNRTSNKLGHFYNLLAEQNLEQIHIVFALVGF